MRRSGRIARRLAPAMVLMMALVILFQGAAGAEMQKYQTANLELFDTVTVIIGYAESRETFAETTAQILQEMEEYHRLYDIYHTYEGINNLKTINDAAGGDPVKVDERIIWLLILARDICERSGGQVDITMGAVLRLWHEARTAGLDNPEQAALPDPELLAEARKHTGFELLEIDELAGTVRLTDPEASLDLGAMAKGYATQKACENVEGSYLVNVGGNVYATGPKPDGEPWIVGVRDPDGGAEDYLEAVTVSRGAVVTSGDYERYYEVDGIRYCHLVDPQTLMPGTRWRSVTVLHDDSAFADELSTALFLMDREAGEKLLRQFGAEACWVTPEGGTEMTEGFHKRLR